MPQYHIAILGIQHEAMMSSPFLSERETTIIRRGDEIIDGQVALIRGSISRISAC
jgi:hypothetical protein